MIARSMPSILHLIGQTKQKKKFMDSFVIFTWIEIDHYISYYLLAVHYNDDTYINHIINIILIINLYLIIILIPINILYQFLKILKLTIFGQTNNC